MLLDILIWMAVAKVAVLLLEDTAYAVRGKQSPRQRDRAQHRAAEAAGQARPRPSSGPGRVRAAVWDYLAGVAEDATAGARSRKRRAQARKRGRQAVDGVFVDLDTDEDGFYADCDLCGWHSRQFRIEANALAAGREHTRTEHPEQYHPDPEPEPANEPAGQGDNSQPGQDEPGNEQGGQQDDGATPDGEAAEPAPAATPAGGRPKLRVIPGGQQDEAAPPQPRPTEQPQPQPRPEPQAAAPEPPRPPAAEDDDPGPQTPEEWERERQRIRESAMDLLRAQGRCIEWDDNGRKFCGAPVDDDVEGAERCRYHLMHHQMQQLSADGRCIQPGPGPRGLCGQPVEAGTESCPQHQDGPNQLRTWGRECPVCGERREGFASEAEARADGANHHCWRCGQCGETNAGFGSHEQALADFNRHAADAHGAAPTEEPTAGSPTDSAGGTPAGTENGPGNPAGAATTTKENTVNLDATGPDEIRAAFTETKTTTEEKGEEITSLAGVLVEAADRFEQLEMAGSTVDLMREAAESLKAAAGQLEQGGEHIEAALADFNAKDGHVADTAADVGNLAGRDVLVGS